MMNFEALPYEQARTVKEQLSDLTGMPGWKTFIEILGARANNFQATMLAQGFVTADKLSQFNYIKGQVEELRSIPLIMEALLSDMREQLKKMQDAQEDDETLPEEDLKGETIQ